MLDGIRDTELILDRTEGAVVAEPATPMLQSIAAAILALKAAGVEIPRPPQSVEIKSEPSPVVEAEEDADARDRRFRRGRS